MDIIARYISDKDKTQTILNHSENAAVLCSKTMKKAGTDVPIGTDTPPSFSPNASPPFQTSPL